MKTIQKILIVSLILFLGNTIFAQKLVCRDGQAKFLASVPTALEEVAATNNTVSAVLDPKTNIYPLGREVTRSSAWNLTDTGCSVILTIKKLTQQYGT